LKVHVEIIITRMKSCSFIEDEGLIIFPKYKFADPLPPIKNEVVLVNEHAVAVVAPLPVTVANVSVSVYEVKYLPSKSTVAPTAALLPVILKTPFPVLNEAPVT